MRKAKKTSETSPEALKELKVMLRAALKHSEEFFNVGAMRAKKELSNGTLVILSITSPENRKRPKRG